MWERAAGLVRGAWRLKIAYGSARPERRRNGLELRTDIAGGNQLVVQTTQSAIGDARAEPRTKRDKPWNTLLERVPFTRAMPASGAAPRVRRATILGNLHGHYPRLFQYDANTCADSA
ncbi:hypothetical protein QFZ91_003076 [Paraburkholderia sp. JPY419]